MIKNHEAELEGLRLKAGERRRSDGSRRKPQGISIPRIMQRTGENRLPPVPPFNADQLPDEDVGYGGTGGTPHVSRKLRSMSVADSIEPGDSLHVVRRKLGRHG